MHSYMFDIVDTAFSYETELTVCSILQDFSKSEGSSLQLICNAHTAFLLCGTELHTLILRYGQLKLAWVKISSSVDFEVFYFEIFFFTLLCFLSPQYNFQLIFKLFPTKEFFLWMHVNQTNPGGSVVKLWHFNCIDNLL